MSLAIEHLDLGFIWDLGFVIWSFSVAIPSKYQFSS
jgi:hypothetical protein